MLHAPRVRALETRHAELELRIASEGSRPRPDDQALQRLKREKLQLKEEMEKLRRAN
ncbi:YdcH family protein [Roseococcus sp. YIM B11640]|uniref:YdcH family protein n=1 Tax=Roseococcus sp. YIM B11640 TaxID=3133973 RepID=UPI003C799CE0